MAYGTDLSFQIPAPPGAAGADGVRYLTPPEVVEVVALHKEHYVAE